MSALQELDIDELSTDAHQHHHETPLVQKVLADAICRPGDDDDEQGATIHISNRHVAAAIDKALGDVADDPLTQHVDEDHADPADHYLDADDHMPDHHHAVDDGPVDLDISALAWGKAIE